MKIFITWSGPNSHAAAVALRDWIPYIFNDIDLFVSSEDIRKGQRWPQEIAKELNASNFGIACLTPDNLEAPWLLFESGALSKVVTEARLFTLLFGGVKIGDINGPLSHFQHTQFEKQDFYKLVVAMNDCLEKGKRDEARLRNLFEKLWPDLENEIPKSFKTVSTPVPKRDVQETLDRLLELTNEIARTMPKEPPSVVFSLPYESLHEVESKFPHTSPFREWFGLSPKLIRKLKVLGILRPEDLMNATPDRLSSSGIPLGDIIEIQQRVSGGLGNLLRSNDAPILGRIRYKKLSMPPPSRSTKDKSKP